MIDEKEFPQIRDYVIKILPEIIRREPEVATAIEGILAQQFPRRDEFARLLDELTAHRQDTKDSFDRVGERFDRVDDEFKEIRHEQRGMRRDIVKLQHGQEMILKKIEGQEDWLRLTIGDMRNLKGRSLEDAVAAGLRYGLKQPELKAENIRLRQRLVDKEGLVFKAGFATEVDLIVENGRIALFEVKSNAKESDVDIFALKVELLAAHNPGKDVKGILI